MNNLKSFILILLMTTITVSAAAQAEVEEWQPDRIKKLKNYTTANLKNFGIGVQFEGMRDYGAGFTFLWRGGSEKQLINLTAGSELVWHNPIDLTPKYHDIKYWRFSPYAALRINVIRLQNSSIYVDGGMSYDLNAESKYRGFDNEISDSLVRHHFSVISRIGFHTYNYDIGIYARYDLKPTFLQQEIYENRNYDYYALGPVMNERWSLGLSLILYLRLD